MDAKNIKFVVSLASLLNIILGIPISFYIVNMTFDTLALVIPGIGNILVKLAAFALFIVGAFLPLIVSSRIATFASSKGAQYHLKGISRRTARTLLEASAIMTIWLVIGTILLLVAALNIGNLKEEDK